MDIFEPPLLFDPAKPFYALVVSYVVQVHGFIDMASRGVLSKLQEMGPEGVERLLNYEGYKVKGFNESVQAIFTGGKTGLIGAQELESKVLSSGIKVDIDGLAEEIYSNPTGPLNYFNRMSAGSLLMLSYELTRAFHTQDPLWEFVRHCRNAAAHKGHFNLRHGEPRRPAKWRKLEITISLQGSPLFNDPPIPGFLGIGDTLCLLSDLEQAFPNIT